MKVVYGKELNREEISLIRNISLECGILFDTAKLLYCRNVDTVEKVKEFLSPDKKRFHSPFLFLQMESIVSRIDYARQNGETVLICGDYDADGICATTILYNCLKEYGVNALYTIPEREDGYGLDLEKIEEICSDNVVDLVITVDCGISEREKIAELIDVGIDVIVTDHHEPPEELPECLIINPKVKGCGYPFDGLCGAGVAYKLGYALIGERADNYLDYVALATVADSMDLIGENRSLVFEGLKIFNSPKLRTVFKHVLGEGVNKQITSQTLAFTIAPRINAGGRMGDANASLKLLLSEDEREIFDLSVKLNTYNVMRQAKCDEIYKQAKDVINENALYNKKAILVANDNWNTGFVGIVASKLVEEYGVPVIVFAGHDGFLKGSARSVSEVNLYNAISDAKEYLITFGGHSQAAGVSVEKENFHLFYDKLCDNIEKMGYVQRVEKEIYAEWLVDGEFSLRFAKELSTLEPFGNGNKKPYFAVKGDKFLSRPIKKGSPHYTFTTTALEMLDFNGEINVLSLALPILKTLIFEPNYSVYKGREQVKGYLKGFSFELSDISLLKEYVLREELLKTITFKGKKFESINCEDVVIEKGYGTMYVLSSVEALKDYKIPEGMALNLFEVPHGNNENNVVLSPKTFPENYERVVFLDKPLSIPAREGVYIPKNGRNVYSKLSVDREVFAEVFRYLCSLENTAFFNSVEVCENKDVPFGVEQFIFSTETFLELKLFYLEDGVLKRNKNLKNALTNSVIYNTICNIVEGV